MQSSPSMVNSRPAVLFNGETRPPAFIPWSYLRPVGLRPVIIVKTANALMFTLYLRCLCVGLVYTGGIDALGRPVIVVNTATALPPERSLDDVLGEMLPRLEPYLSQVQYGGVVRACSTGLIPVMLHTI